MNQSYDCFDDSKLDLLIFSEVFDEFLRDHGINPDDLTEISKEM